jgi:uncharacterized protein
VSILLFLPAGIAIGILSGFFGLGGGLLLTPVLLLLGYSPVEAISISLLFSIGTSVSSVWGHIKLNNIRWKAAITIGVSGIVGTQIAHPLVLFFEREGIGEAVLSALYLILLLYFSISLLKKAKPTAAKEPKGNTLVMLYILIGFVGGFLSTALGVGGGFIVVPLLVSILSFPPRVAVGTSAVCIFLFVSVGFGTYALSVDIDYIIGGILIVGALIGGQLGAKTTALFKNADIQKLLGILYAVTWLSVFSKLISIELVGLGLLAAYTIYLLILFATRTWSQKKTTATKDRN